MLNRRTFFTMVLLSPALACKPAQLPARSIEVAFSEGERENLIRQIQSFANIHGLSFHDRSLPSRAGVTYTFELRSRDLLVEGLNPPKDIEDPVPLRTDGTPNFALEVDTSKFRVLFFRRTNNITDEDFEETILQFATAVETVEDTTVRRVN